MRIIDADKKYMYPDEELMKEWFNEFNKRFFEGKLPLYGYMWGMDKNTCLDSSMILGRRNQQVFILKSVISHLMPDSSDRKMNGGIQ